ncbi:MAG TPA: hypothetical protein VNR39_12200 [Pseudolabrys sp.]|nr:hypothetical protein [Pseudolabrys sp.]
MTENSQQPKAQSLFRGKPGPKCAVCSHKHKHLIDYALVQGKPLRVIAEEFDVSFYSVGRHSRRHLGPAQRAAIMTKQRPDAVDVDKMRDKEASGLLASVLAHRVRLEAIAERAHTLDDLRAATAAEAAVATNLALTAKLLGQLVQRVDVRHSNLMLTPDYLKLRSGLIEALRPFPDAGRAVAAMLARMESDAAKDITDAATRPKGGAPAPEPTVIEHDPPPPLAPLAPLAAVVTAPPPVPPPGTPPAGRPRPAVLPPLPDSR